MRTSKKDIIDSLVSDWKKEQPLLDTSAMEIVGRILRLGKLLEKSAGKAIKDFGIHYTDLDVLATLRRSGKPYELTPKQLMKSVLITSSSMTALLDRLAKMELIYRATDRNDKRIRSAGLTEKGLKILDEAILLRFREATDSIQVLGRDEKDDLRVLLKKLLSNLDNT